MVNGKKGRVIMNPYSISSSVNSVLHALFTWCALDCILHHLTPSLNNPKSLSAFVYLPDSLRNLPNAPGELPKMQTSSCIDLYKDHACACGH